MISPYKTIWFFILFPLIITTSLAQEACETIVQTAIETASENCDDLRRNQACYGNVIIDAVAAPDVADLTFDDAGDIVNVSDIASMRLTSQVEDSGEWGISIMQVPVITDETTETAQFVLFGDVELSTTNDFSGEADETPTPQPATVELTASSNLNIRGGPSTSNAVVGSLSNGDVITAMGRNEAGDWVQFVQDDGSVGWVFASLMSTTGDTSTLPIVSTDNVVEESNMVEEPAFESVQSFYVRTGVADRPCDEAPDSGVLIQTPEGVGQLEIMVNEVRIQLGSTAYLRLEDNAHMEIIVIEGLASIIAQQDVANVPAGSRVLLPIQDGISSGIPGAVEPYDPNQFGLLPLDLLNRPIEVADAFDPRSLGDSFPAIILTQDSTYEGSTNDWRVQNGGFQLIDADGTARAIANIDWFTRNICGKTYVTKNSNNTDPNIMEDPFHGSREWLIRGGTTVTLNISYDERYRGNQSEFIFGGFVDTSTFDTFRVASPTNLLTYTFENDSYGWFTPPDIFFIDAEITINISCS